jgi:hypothetical protein
VYKLNSSIFQWKYIEFNRWSRFAASRDLRNVQNAHGPSWTRCASAGSRDQVRRGLGGDVILRSRFPTTSTYKLPVTVSWRMDGGRVPCPRARSSATRDATPKLQPSSRNPIWDKQVPSNKSPVMSSLCHGPRDGIDRLESRYTATLVMISPRI